MMSGAAFPLPSSLAGLPPCSNPSLPNHHQSPPPPPPQAKKKRNLPGNPDPDAEVISLSPRSLMATNRFLCEICGKGFQRDQNLQLHRRGHNLPWKLRQRAPGAEARKRVYVCPEPSCIHHDPSRALGDLTGIKKHFSRKHGEKKWKCERCSKKYAVRSDWKAHSKTCGTREYKCDCGTIFSRKDSFITHRAFCDALTQESMMVSSSSSIAVVDPAGSDQSKMDASPIFNYVSEHDHQKESISIDCQAASSNFHFHQSMPPHGPSFFAADSVNVSPQFFAGKGGGVAETVGSLYSTNQIHQSRMATAANMSATALLQKAAQMGATSSNPSSTLFFGGLLSSAAKGSSRSEARVLGHEKKDGFQDLMTSEFPSSSEMMAMAPWGREGDHGMTRDFLGLGGDGSGRQSFLQQELAKFASMGSGMDLI